MPLKTRSRRTIADASYLIGVYSKRNLCFVAGRSTTLSCLNQDFSMPSSLTKSMSVPTMPSMDSLLMHDRGRWIPEQPGDFDVIVFAGGPAGS